MTALAPTGIVPKPPTAFATHVTDLPVGAVLWRIHAEKLAGDAFNPGFGSSRFAPIGPVRKRVPTAYAADGFEAAVYETIFHDLDPAQSFKTFPLSKLADVRCSVLRVASPLALRSFPRAGPDETRHCSQSVDRHTRERVLGYAALVRGAAPQGRRHARDGLGVSRLSLVAGGDVLRRSRAARSAQRSQRRPG